MINRKSTPRNARQRPGFQIKNSSPAFSLVEVALALAITAFCLVAIFGLIPVGLTSNQTSTEQTAAANISRAIVADLRASTTGATSSIFGINLPASGGNNTTGAGGPSNVLFFTEDGGPIIGNSAIVSGTTARYRAAIGFAPPPATANLKAVTSVRLLISWPALADQNTNSWPKNASGTYEIVTALDRN